MLSPLFRAMQQLDDPVFVGVLVRSLAWSLLAFLGLLGGSAWAVQHLVGQPGWLGWAAGIAGGLGAALLAAWLFVPAAVLIATLYIERVASAVDRRFYPTLLPPQGGAAISVQVWDGVALGARVLGWQIVALLLAIALPGVGLVLGWAVTGWAIGRGLFVAVAMRRMTRAQALRVYAERRGPVLLLGLLLALAGTVPLLNLVVPVLGVAALTHVLNQAWKGFATR
jgi:CysZ protein